MTGVMLSSSGVAIAAAVAVLFLGIDGMARAVIDVGLDGVAQDDSSPRKTGGVGGASRSSLILKGRPLPGTLPPDVDRITL